MTTTLVLPDSIALRLRAATALEVETAAVLLARVVPDAGGGLRLLATQLLEVPEGGYERREAQSLQISSTGYVPALQLASEAGAVPIWLHTHPGEGSSPRPSRRDRLVDEQISDLFRLRAGSNYYGAVVLARTGDQLRFAGHIEDDSGRRDIDRLVSVGSRITVAWNDFADAPALDGLHDRNIRAFGGEVQRMLHDLRIGVVGCGGTGSAIAEQLVRLGVRNLMLIDPDSLADTNLTRVYGSYPADVGRAKVDVLGDHLQMIAPSLVVTRLKSMVTEEATARRLASSDLIFGCTDDNAGRLVLSRIATYQLAPVIDCGVILTADSSGYLDGVFGRVTVLYPGAACLVCRNRVDLARAASELMTPTERVRRVDEGYAPALPGAEPAVIAFTSLVASTAVSELLERLTGYGNPDVPSEVLLRVHDREVSTNSHEPHPQHYCHPDAGKFGLGLTDPFLEQTWLA